MTEGVLLGIVVFAMLMLSTYSTLGGLLDYVRRWTSSPPKIEVRKPKPRTVKTKAIKVKPVEVAYQDRLERIIQDERAKLNARR